MEVIAMPAAARRLDSTKVCPKLSRAVLDCENVVFHVAIHDDLQRQPHPAFQKQAFTLDYFHAMFVLPAILAN